MIPLASTISSETIRNRLQDVAAWEPSHQRSGDLPALLLLAVASLLVEAIAVSRVLLGAARPPMTQDAAVFQHIGWYLANGAGLYVDTWDPKLPLSYETTAVLALVTGDDMLALHLASVGLMALAAVGIVVLVGTLTLDITHDPRAALVAGLSMLLLPGFHVRPAYGFKAKYLVLLFGLLAIWLYRRDRPAIAGAAAAASVGYWQLGAVFPLLVLGLAVQRREWRGFGWATAGGLAFTVVMLLPVLYQGTLGRLVVQAVIAPLVAPDPAPIPLRLYAGVLHFKYATPLVFLGSLGLLQFRDGRQVREHWWVLAGAAWFGFVVFFVDFETGGYTDLIPGTAFVAIGLGLLFAVSRPAVRRWLFAVIVAVVTINVLVLGAAGVVFEPVSTPGPVPLDELRVTDDPAVLQSPAVPNDVPDIRYVYWNRQRPDSCHYRFSTNEIRWLERTGGYGSGCLGLAEALDKLGWSW